MSASPIFEAVVTAEKEDVSMLIGADQLQEKLDDKTLRILDTRSKEEFEKGHIPGTVHVDVAEWKSLVASPNGLHDAGAKH